MNNLLTDELTVGGKEKDPWAVGTRAVKRLEIMCKYCSVAVLDGSESLGNARA